MQQRITQKIIKEANKMLSVMKLSGGRTDEEYVGHIAEILWVDRVILQGHICPKKKKPKKK